MKIGQPGPLLTPLLLREKGYIRGYNYNHGLKLHCAELNSQALETLTTDLILLVASGNPALMQRARVLTPKHARSPIFCFSIKAKEDIHHFKEFYIWSVCIFLDQIWCHNCEYNR